MIKSKEKSNLTRKEAALSKQSAAFIDLLMARGYIGDPNIEDEKIREAKQKNAARTFHNTRLLLENYRTVTWMLECIPDEIAEDLKAPTKNLDALLDKVDLELSMENRKLESRLYSATKTRMLLERVNEAISILRKNPEKGEEMYQIIYKTYVDPHKRTVDELFVELRMAQKTYYRLRNRATMLISLFLWSAPGTDVEMLLEVMYVLEEMKNMEFLDS